MRCKAASPPRTSGDPPHPDRLLTEPRAVIRWAAQQSGSTVPPNPCRKAARETAGATGWRLLALSPGASS